MKVRQRISVELNKRQWAIVERYSTAFHTSKNVVIGMAVDYMGGIRGDAFTREILEAAREHLNNEKGD